MLLWSCLLCCQVIMRTSKCVQPTHNSRLFKALLYIPEDNYNVPLMAKVVSFQDSSANGSPCVSFRFILCL